MKKLNLSILSMFLTLFSFGQTETVLDYPWTVGVGINIVDNDGFQFGQPFDTDNWNFKNPIMFSGEYRIKNYLATNLALSFNSLESKNLQNNGTLPTNYALFAIDASAKLYFDQFYLPTYQLNWIETYALLGLGYTNVKKYNTGTFNAGLGLQFWFTKERDIGLRLQTAGKWGFNEWIYLKNYIQHSAEVIYRF